MSTSNDKYMLNKYKLKNNLIIRPYYTAYIILTWYMNNMNYDRIILMVLYYCLRIIPIVVPIYFSVHMVPIVSLPIFHWMYIDFDLLNIHFYSYVLYYHYFNRYFKVAKR